jgi:hypothetical protein
MIERQEIIRSGAITFLDVLGWKGIWARRSEPIDTLLSLVARLEDQAKKLIRGLAKAELETKVFSISDTIILLTRALPCDAHDVLQVHGRLCEWLIPESIECGIPVRGATAYGSFSVNEKERIFLGPAIDEAAAWYDLGDWIGVFMAPTGKFMIERDRTRLWKEWEVPLKNGRRERTLVVNWSECLDLRVLQRSFQQMAPITPDIVSKFSNTIDFVQNVSTLE